MLAVVSMSKSDVRKMVEDIDKVDPRYAKPEFIEGMPEDHLLTLNLELGLPDADAITAIGRKVFHFINLMNEPTTVCASDQVQMKRLACALRYLSNNVMGLVSYDIKKNPSPETEKKNGRRG
jgi:hypothetical protein